MDTFKKHRVHISALADGEIAPDDLELALAALQSPDGQQAWDTYFRIGDELRAMATPALSDGFHEALAARLDAEPPVNRRSRAAEGAAKRTAGRTGAGNKRGRTAPGGRAAAGASTNTATGAAASGADAATDIQDAKAVIEQKPAVVSVS